jgi:TonB family protein
MKHHGAIGESRGGGSFDFGRVFLIVVGIHVLFGLGLLWMAKTGAGQNFAKTYNIKLFQAEKPPEPEKPEVANEPPPPAPVVEAPKAELPKVASAPPSSAVAAPKIGGGGGALGTSWGGKFAGGNFDGPEGAFHAGVTRVFRDAYQQPKTDFGAAEVELTVSGSGQVSSFRLAKSSGDPTNDQALLAAARTVQSRGLPAPPESRPRAVTVRFYPR